LNNAIQKLENGLDWIETLDFCENPLDFENVDNDIEREV